MAPINLRVITYLCPSLPVEYFETFCHYLEAKLNVYAGLIYESRWDGPPKDRPDPFTTDQVDIAFLSSSSFLHLQDSKNAYATLLPVTSVHQHRKGEDQVGYYSDVIVHKELEDKIKEFLDLRGCKWAYSRETSTSGYLVVRKNLKTFGESPSFFGNLLPAGNHINAIKMVQERQADAAAVDANCLSVYTKHNPVIKDNIFVLESWGPLPSYPIIINRRLPDSFQRKLTNALLTMHKDDIWRNLFAAHGVLRFAENDSMTYETERELLKNVKGLTLEAVYY